MKRSIALLSTAIFDAQRRGNLAAAREAIVQADCRIDMDQHDNHGPLAGHAQHAEDALMQANAQLRQAATFADQR